ncbi:MAG: ABC transporter permease, partial [Actinobacteria bacterium]|nr:ABC transporter permease [Actinomycetota bacterium]
RGVVGRLARTNAIRNPRRTAATAFALTLGLVLVAGIAVVGSSMKASTGQIIDNTVTADYIVSTSASVQLPLPAADAVKHLPGVATVTELHPLATEVDGVGRDGEAVDGSLPAVAHLDMQSGSAAVTGRQMIVSQKMVTERHWTMGTQHVLSVPGSAPITVTITGVYADNQLMGPWVVSGDVYRALTPRNQWADDVALVRATPGTNLVTLRTELERATNSFYVVSIQDRDQFKGQVASQINGLLGLLYGLLGLAIVIAVLGIINTQALSVIERRRELGMLRAIGMQRKQVRRTVYLESLLISVFGAVLGVAVGLSFGALFARTLRGRGLDVISVPWSQAALFVVLAAVVGVLAALWPGFRAARTKPLAAI